MDLKQIARDISNAYIPLPSGRLSQIANPDIVFALLSHIRNGNYPSVAAELSDVSETTLSRWLKRGEEGEAPYEAFRRAVKRVSAEAEAIEVGKVRKAGELPQFWTASMTYLERRHPDRWARRSEPTDHSKVIIQIGLTPSQTSVILVQPQPQPGLNPHTSLDPIVNQLGE